MQVERRRGLPLSSLGVAGVAIPLFRPAQDEPAGGNLARACVARQKVGDAPAEQMILKFKRLTQKQQTMLQTLADELLLTVLG